MSTQKYDSGTVNLGNVTTEVEFNTGARTLTGIRAEVSGDTEVHIYCSFKDGVWDIICADNGEPYILNFKEAASYIPLNPQFFYGLDKIKLVVVSGGLSNVIVVERMV